MNSFCLHCTAGDRQEVRECLDRNCPFFKHRRHNVDFIEGELLKGLEKDLEELDYLVNEREENKEGKINTKELKKVVRNLKGRNVERRKRKRKDKEVKLHFQYCGNIAGK